MAKIASRENSVRKQTKRGIFERQEYAEMPLKKFHIFI